MKRRWIAALAILLAAALTACAPLVETEPETINLYASVYPIYALTEGLMRDVPDAELHCLVQPQDGCLRSYALSDWDIYLLASADGVIMGGRGLESFESTLFSLSEAGLAASAVLYNLELYNQDDSGGSDEDASHLDGANPHLYMSVDGAKEIVQSIAATLSSLDPRYSEEYLANLEAVEGELDALKAQMNEIAGDARGNRVILMNEALIYVAQDYDLDVAAWYDRESGEGLYDDDLEACLEELSAAEADVVLIEQQAPQALVAALEEAGFQVARLDILSTHRESDGFEGYIEAQMENARAIREAFDRAGA